MKLDGNPHKGQYEVPHQCTRIRADPAFFCLRHSVHVIMTAFMYQITDLQERRTRTFLVFFVGI